ncbi:MAG: ribosome maturation factor RimM [Terriglobales bacterium]
MALVIKTQGRRGEVATELHTDVPDRFKQGMRLWALLKGGERREVTVEELWPHKSFLVLKFEGVETISDAEELKGAELQVPRGERAELEPGWTYLSDLIDCSVFDGEREIGRVTDVVFGAGEAPLLVVHSEKDHGAKQSPADLPYEIPFADAYLVSVDVQHKVVRMRLPEGLLDVNGPIRKSGL